MYLKQCFHCRRFSLKYRKSRWLMQISGRKTGGGLQYSSNKSKSRNYRVFVLQRANFAGCVLFLFWNAGCKGIVWVLTQKVVWTLENVKWELETYDENCRAYAGQDLKLAGETFLPLNWQCSKYFLEQRVQILQFRGLVKNVIIRKNIPKLDAALHFSYP